MPHCYARQVVVIQSDIGILRDRHIASLQEVSEDVNIRRVIQQLITKEKSCILVEARGQCVSRGV